MKGPEIVRLEEKDLEDAVGLVLLQYRRELEKVPILPRRHLEGGEILAKLKRLFERAPGIAAKAGGELLGFVIGVRISAFKGYHDGVYCPEWANAAAGPDRFGTYRKMYEKISEIWADNGCFTHAVTVFSHDREAVDAWFQSGFGLGPMDAVRPLEPVSANPSEGLILRRLDVEDIDALLPLAMGLSRYMASAPNFHPLLDTETREYYEKWLYNRDNCVWAAFDGEKAVSYMKCEPSYEGASYIIRDPGTFSINGAYTLPSYREEGVMASLLNLAIAHAEEEEFERIAVDFESYNVKGCGFWTKHFTPFCSSVIRKIDERSAWAGASRDVGNIW